MPIQGFTRFRNWQLGKQTLINTAVPATRRMPYSGDPTNDPHWTDPTVDVGSLDPILPPYKMAPDITAPWAGPLNYNDAAILLSAGLKGGVTPGGPGPSTWVFHPSSLSSDPFDLYTAEWGDDVVGDQVQFVGGTVEKLVFTMPQDLGPWTVAADWRFAAANYPVAETAGLVVDSAPEYVYGADTELYINDTSGAIGTTKLTDAFHDAVVTITNNYDIKRYPNGSNTRFQVSGYGRGARMIEVQINFAKQTATLAEAVKWLNASSVHRFLELRTTAVAIAGGGLPYKFSQKFAGRWYTRTETAIGGNTGFQLMGRAYYDASLGYATGFDIVNSLAALP